MVLGTRIGSGCGLAGADMISHGMDLAIMDHLEAAVVSELNRPRPRRQMLVHAVIVL